MRPASGSRTILLKEHTLLLITSYMIAGGHIGANSMEVYTHPVISWGKMDLKTVSKCQGSLSPKINSPRFNGPEVPSNLRTGPSNLPYNTAVFAIVHMNMTMSCHTSQVVFSANRSLLVCQGMSVVLHGARSAQAA